VDAVRRVLCHKNAVAARANCQVIDFKGNKSMPCFKAKLKISVWIKHLADELKTSSQSCPQFPGESVKQFNFSNVHDFCAPAAISLEINDFA